MNDNVENLKEVIINSNTINDKKLAEINTQLQNQIKNDIKNNPNAYIKPNPEFRANLSTIIGLVVNLLSKKKSPEPEITTMKHKDLIDYFKDDYSYLIQDLNIPEDQINYFFVFVEEQNIPAELLTEENEFFFLEKLNELSIGFL